MFQALTNICENPALREEIRKKHMNDIEAIQVKEDVILTYKKNLLNVIEWTPATAT